MEMMVDDIRVEMTHVLGVLKDQLLETDMKMMVDDMRVDVG